MAHRTLLFSALAALAAGGCEAADSLPTPTTPGPEPSLADAVRGVSERMHGRWHASDRLELAIAHGDLATARSSARWIADAEEPDVRPAVRPYFDEVRTAAGMIAESTSLSAAAHGAGLLAARCAHCHAALAARITLPPAVMPPDDPRQAPRMTPHQWGAAQMWAGLIAGSDAHWNAGASALASLPPDIVAQAVTPTSPVDLDDVARLKSYGTRALATADADARGELFGRALETCAHCHAVLRDR